MFRIRVDAIKTSTTISIVRPPFYNYDMERDKFAEAEFELQTTLNKWQGYIYIYIYKWYYMHIVFFLFSNAFDLSVMRIL